MKTSVGLGVVLVLLALTGCGGGDDPVAPPPPTPPLATETVGSAGGELVTPDLILTVPAGALAADTDLSIYADATESPFDPNPVYRLEGLPEELAAPVTLRLRYDAAKGVSATLLLGEERESYEGGRGLTWFDVAARDSAGWCVADLDRGPYQLDAAKAAPSFQVSFAADLAQAPTSGGHFRIFYDPQRVTDGQVALLAGHLEQAWNEVVALGFNFGNQDIWPRPVYLRDLDHLGRLAQYTTAPWGKGHFTIDPDALLNSLAMGIVVGHEVLHCAQDFFDTRSPAQWKTLNYDRLALDEATASWFEGKFYPEDDSYPLSMNLVYYSMPLNMFAGLKGYSIAETGYGLSSLIKYIVEGQGEGRIREMYDRFVVVGSDAEAIQDAVNPPMADWVVDFHHRQIMNQNYPYLQPGELWYDLPSEGALVGGEHQVFLPTAKLWEMGADVTVFTVADDRDVKAPFLKAISGSDEAVQMSLFGLSEGQHPVLLGSARDSVRVEDLPDLTQVYEKFMVMSTRIARFDPGNAQAVYPRLTVRMEEDGLAGFETASITLRVDAQFVLGQIPGMEIKFESHAGRVVGNEYYAEWDWVDTYYNIHYYGYLSLTFNLETMDLIAWSGQSSSYFTDILTLRTETMSGGGLPLDWDAGDEFRYMKYQVPTCGVVTNLTVTRHVKGELTDWLTSYYCDENSSIYITLRNEE